MYIYYFIYACIAYCVYLICICIPFPLKSTGILVTGLSLGYLVTAEFQRRRIWEYWRLQWYALCHHRSHHGDNPDGHDHSESTTSKQQPMDCGSIDMKHLVSPRTHRTSQFHVHVLTIPPKRRLTGRSQGVECYHVVRGTIQVLRNGIECDSDDGLCTVFVVNPFVERAIYNPSSTVSAVVYRSTDGPTKDDTSSEESNPTTYARSATATAALVKNMSDNISKAFGSLSSSILPFAKISHGEGIGEAKGV